MNSLGILNESTEVNTSLFRFFSSIPGQCTIWCLIRPSYEYWRKIQKIGWTCCDTMIMTFVISFSACAGDIAMQSTFILLTYSLRSKSSMLWCLFSIADNMRKKCSLLREQYNLNNGSTSRHEMYTCEIYLTIVDY